MDVVVVGGGIHGVGVAQAAAAAGYSVGLIEARRVAAGTSSRSSKLIHGGLRYLETFQFRLVRESLLERQRLLKLAPDLVRLVPFTIPVYRTSRRPPWQIRSGLSLYALLGGLGRHARFSKVARAEWESLDGLEREGLRAVYRYYDGQTDDAALCRAVLASAVALGTEVRVPAELQSARREGDGWSLEVESEGRSSELQARTLVNAAGPWAAEVQERLKGAPPPLAADLVGGTHIELAGELEGGIYYAEAVDDRRPIFVMPWKTHTLVGTTERFHSGDPADVAPTDEEIEYLERSFRRYFPGRPVERLDAWAGLRVLPKGEGSANRRPREVRLQVDDERRPSVLTIWGGKLTGYRLTAQKVMQRLAPSLPARKVRGRTDELRLEAS